MTTVRIRLESASPAEIAETEAALRTVLDMPEDGSRDYRNRDGSEGLRRYVVSDGVRSVPEWTSDLINVATDAGQAEWTSLCRKAFENLPSDTPITFHDIDAILTWVLSDYEQLTAGRRNSPGRPRGRYRLTCHGVTYAECFTEETAKTTTAGHVLVCPELDMQARAARLRPQVSVRLDWRPLDPEGFGHGMSGWVSHTHHAVIDEAP